VVTLQMFSNTTAMYAEAADSSPKARPLPQIPWAVPLFPPFIHPSSR